MLLYFKIMASRTKPNVFITGTPGTGKTTLSELLATRIGFTCISMGDVLKQQRLLGVGSSEYLPEFDTHVFSDEDGDIVRQLYKISFL